MNKLEVRHLEIWQISDAHYENSIHYTPFQLDLLILGSVENGQYQLIQEYIDHALFEYLESVLPEKEKWLQVMCFACGSAYAFAVKGGLSCERASAVSIKYTNLVSQINDARQFIQLQIEMYIQYAREVYDVRMMKSGNVTVDRAIDYIDEHIDMKLSNAQIAAACSYSVSRLQHLFAIHMKMSITAYIRKKKIEKACFLLGYTTMSCTKIAEKLSYSSQAYFTKQFYAEMKMTPLKYRQSGQYK